MEIKVIEAKANRETELKNRKEILHPDVEKYVIDLENDYSTLMCHILNDTVHHSELTEVEMHLTDVVNELRYVYDSIVKGPPDHKVNSEDLARIANKLKIYEKQNET